MFESEEDDLAQLLNGLDNEFHLDLNDDHIFYDTSGRPTDKFLQALKDDDVRFLRPSGTRETANAGHNRPQQRQIQEYNGVNHHENSSKVSAPFHSPSHHIITELSKEEIASETKTKSLELRVRGQLRTIRELEAKVNELQEQLALRDKQIVTLSTRLRNAGNTTMAETRGLTAVSKGSSAHLRVEKLQAQIDTLELRLGDEQQRRQRAEERFRILKSHLEEHKLRHSELAKKEMESEKTCQALHQKLQVNRKDCKELVGALHVQRLLVSEVTMKCNEFKSRAEAAEMRCKQAQLEIDSAANESKMLRSQIMVANSKIRNLETEIGYMKDNESTRKTEEQMLRLAGASSRRESIHRKSPILTDMDSAIQQQTTRLDREIAERNQPNPEPTVVARQPQQTSWIGAGLGVSPRCSTESVPRTVEVSQKPAQASFLGFLERSSQYSTNAKASMDLHPIRFDEETVTKGKEKLSKLQSAYSRVVGRDELDIV